MMTRNVREKYRGSLCLVLSILGLICLVSCYPEFKNPLPPPADLKADPQILGTWVRTYKADQSESKEQLSIFPRKSGWIDVVWIYAIDSEVSADGVNVLVLEGYSTSANKQRFLCLRFREKDYSWARQNHTQSDKEPGNQPFTTHWIIVAYEILKNDLVIKPFSTRRVEEFIEKGKLKGEVVRGKELFRTPEQPLDQVTVTSSSDELAQVISKEGAGAFIWDDPNDTFRFMNVLVFSRLGKQDKESE